MIKAKLVGNCLGWFRSSLVCSSFFFWFVSMFHANCVLDYGRFRFPGLYVRMLAVISRSVCMWRILELSIPIALTVYDKMPSAVFSWLPFFLELSLIR